MLSKFGNTVEEIRKDFGNIVYPFINQGSQEHMEVVFSNTLYGFLNISMKIPLTL